VLLFSIYQGSSEHNQQWQNGENGNSGSEKHERTAGTAAFTRRHADCRFAEEEKTLQREILKKRFCGVNAIDSQIRSESFCARADRQHSVQCYLLVLITAPYQGARQVKILRHAPSLFVCFKQVSDETSILWSLEGEAAFLSRPAGPEA
jgi:hypothetical protein